MECGGQTDQDYYITCHEIPTLPNEDKMPSILQELQSILAKHEGLYKKDDSEKKDTKTLKNQVENDLTQKVSKEENIMDEQVLTDHCLDNIQKESTSHLVLCLRGGMQIFLKTLTLFLKSLFRVSRRLLIFMIILMQFSCINALKCWVCLLSYFLLTYFAYIYFFYVGYNQSLA